MAFDPGLLLGNLKQIGAFEFLFPFLLALAVFYGVLEFALGRGKERILPKSAIGLISLVLAFFVMNYTGSLGYSITQYFSTLFGSGLVIGSGILVVIILLGLLGFRLKDVAEKDKNTKAVGLVVGAIVLIALALFMNSSGSSLPGIGSFYLDSSIWTFIAFIVILIAVMWFLGREGNGGGGGGGGGTKPP